METQDNQTCNLGGHLSLWSWAYSYVSIVNANFCQSYVSYYFRWKLVRHLDCFGDNRRTKDTRKIKLCDLKECCVTLSSYSISHKKKKKKH